jgi:WD40 repeat protein
MSFDNDGDHFAAAGVANRSTWVWDLHGPPTARPWILGGGTDRAVSRVMLSGDGRWLVSSHALGESGFLWPVEIGRPHVLESDTDMVGPAVFLAGGRRIVAAVRDGSIRAWPLVSAAGFASSTLFEMPSGHASDMAADPSGRYVLAAGAGGAWLVPTDGGSARRLLHPSLETSGAAFSSDGKLAATSAVEDSGSRKRVLRVWNLETGEERVSDGVEHREGDTCRLEFSPDGTHLYGSIASALFVWDLTERSLRPIEGEGLSIAIAPDGREIFTSGNTIHPAPETRVYNPVEGTFRVLAGHVDTTSIALDAEGGFVVTGSLDGTIKVSPTDGGEPHLLVGHRQAVNVSVSPNGRRILSIGLDGTMCLWRVPDISRPPLHTLPREELIAKLETFTNLRVARGEDSSTGWKVEVGALPGWESVPTW